MYKSLISSVVSVTMLITSFSAPMTHAGGYHRSGVSVGIGTSYRHGTSYRNSHFHHGYRHHYRPRHYQHRHHRHSHYYSGYRYSPYYNNSHFSVGFRTHLDSTPAAVVLGGLTLFYLGGIFYKSLQHNDVYSSAPRKTYHRPTYEVVSAPIGAYVNVLPSNASRLQVDGQTYHVYANTYYRWDSARNAYQVVNAPVTQTYAKTLPSSVAQPALNSAVHMPRYTVGSDLIALPVGARAIKIKGQQYFEVDGYYFRPTQRAGRLVYEVVSL